MMTVFLFSFVWQWLDDIFTSVFLQNVPMLTTELFRLISNSAGVDAGISNLTEFSLMRNCGMPVPHHSHADTVSFLPAVFHRKHRTGRPGRLKDGIRRLIDRHPFNV